MVSGLSSRAWEVLFFLTVRRSPAALVFSPVSVVNLRGMAVTSVSSSGRSDSRDPPGSSVHGILPARILEWIAIPFYRGLPNPGIEAGGSPTLQADPLPSEP